MNNKCNVFKFTHHTDPDGCLYTATITGDTCKVSWEENGVRDDVDYSTEEAKSHVLSGVWKCLDQVLFDDNKVEISLSIRKGALYVEKKFSTFEELTSYALAAEEAFDY